VLMFIPLESSFSLAIKEEPNLYQLAWDKRVVFFRLTLFWICSVLWNQP
jgi:DNA anti-recombination protein RmuC